MLMLSKIIIWFDKRLPDWVILLAPVAGGAMALTAIPVTAGIAESYPLSLLVFAAVTLGVAVAGSSLAILLLLVGTIAVWAAQQVLRWLGWLHRPING